MVRKKRRLLEIGILSILVIALIASLVAVFGTPVDDCFGCEPHQPHPTGERLDGLEAP